MLDLPLPAAPWSGSDIAWVYKCGDISATYDDFAEGVWTVPSGVTSVSFMLFGAVGFAPGFPQADRMTPVHSVNWPVTPGDEVRFGSGAPAGQGHPTHNGHGNHPWVGGTAQQNASNYRAYSGGGASVLTIAGSVVAVGGGGAGWFLDLDTGTATAPTGGTAGSGAGGAGGDGALPLPTFDDRSGGGGGGAAPGAGGAVNGFGENGGSLVPSADGGGDPSPSWAELGLDPDDTSPWLPQLSLVALWYFIPAEAAARGWHLGRVRY